MRRIALVLAVAFLLGVGAVLLDPFDLGSGRREGGPEAAPTLGVPDARPADGGAPALRGTGRPGEPGDRDGAALPPPVDFAAVDRSRDLHGVVVRRDGGAPVAGAEVAAVTYPWRRVSVLVYDLFDSTVPGPGTRSAADGTFSLRLAPGEQVALRVSAEGLAPVELGARQAGERVRVEMVEAVRLTVVTRDAAGKPVAGSRLRLWSREGDAPRLTGVTGADGTCALWLPAACVCTLEVVPERLGYPGWQTVTCPAKGEHEVVVVLEEGRTLTGRVVDAETGAPLAGARVGMNWVMHPHTRSEPDGTWRLPGWVGKGVRDVHCVADGYGRSQWEVDGDGHEFALTRGDAVTGRLLSRAGRPVAGAQVTAIASERRFGSQQICSRWGASDEEGRFLLEGLRRDLPHSLVVLAEGYGRTHLDFDPRAEGAGTVDLGDLVLPPGRTIAGRVLTHDGEPVARVRVALAGANADRGRLRGGAAPAVERYGTVEERSTDDLGRFRFPDLAAGEYVLRAVRPGMAPSERTLALPEGADLGEVEVRLPEGRAFVVTVVDEDGKPVPQAYVSVATATAAPSGQSDAQGRVTFFVAGRVGEVTADPFATGRDLLRTTQPVPEGATEHRIVLLPAGQVAGRVVQEDGSPLPGAWVVARRGEEQLASTPASADGTFALRVPRTGRFEVALLGVAAGRGPIEPGDYAADPVPAAAGGTDVVLRVRRLARDRTLRVRVTLPDGTPVEGASVFLGTRRGETGADGVAAFADLTERPVTAMTGGGAAREGFVAPRPQQVVPAGQEVVLVLRAARPTEGTVLRPDGAPAERARVEMWEGERPRYTTATDAEGRFRLPTAEEDAGPWRVRAVLGEWQGEVLDVRTGDTEVRIQLR